MKGKLCAVLCIFVAAIVITACGSSFKAAESTVYVTKDGTVKSANIEDFSKDYYDEKELKDYITQSVDDYIASNGDGSIKIDSFKVASTDDKGDTAQLYLSYMTFMDYALFNGIEFFAGTIPQAQDEGYDFEQGFQSVKEAELAGGADFEQISKDENSEDDNKKVVIIGEETIVKVDGTIQFVSDGNVEPVSKDTARVHYDAEDPDAPLAYIIYTNGRES